LARIVLVDLRRFAMNAPLATIIPPDPLPGVPNPDPLPIPPIPPMPIPDPTPAPNPMDEVGLAA
jgi:hypothetical protein